MKKILLFIFVTFSCYVQAQKTVTLKRADSIVFGKAQLDFAIPDIPAFKAIGADPSNILRPSSAKQFALSFSEFASNKFSTIPKNVAVEVAPALIFNTWYTLNDYVDKPLIRWLAKTRFSLGSNEDAETKMSSVAFGMRTTLLEKGDFRKDMVFLRDSIYTQLELINSLGSNAAETLSKLYGVVAVANMTAEKREFLIDSMLKKSHANVDGINNYINNSIENYKRTNWNASRIDVAYSSLFQSPDSLVSKIKLNKHLLWATFALKPWKNNNWGQILIGINTSSYKVERKWQTDLTGNLRLYAGTNRLKGLFELQFKNRDPQFAENKKSLFSQIGIEVNPYKAIWLQFSTGIINAFEGSNKSALRSNLNIAITFPEDFKLF